MDSAIATDLHPAFVDSLAAERDALNARFALRVRSGARIDSHAFNAHLAQAVNQLIGAVHSVQPERTRGVVMALYDVSLDLFAASLLGPGAKLPYLGHLWREVLPTTAKLLAREPQRVAGALSNAIYQIASQSGTRPTDWLTCLAQLAPDCESVDRLLDVGKILAWRSGMVQYRAAALQILRQISHSLALRVLRLPESTSTHELAAVLDRMTLNPWLRCKASDGFSTRDAVPELVAAVGAFRGFGGPFRRPPTIRYQDNLWFASDGNSEWQILADSFGTLFQRVGDATEKSARKKRKPRKPSPAPGTEVTIDAEGIVRWGERDARFEYLANPTSYACDGTTFGVTIATSHHVFLISRNVPKKGSDLLQAVVRGS